MLQVSSPEQKKEQQFHQLYGIIKLVESSLGSGSMWCYRLCWSLWHHKQMLKCATGQGRPSYFIHRKLYSMIISNWLSQLMPHLREHLQLVFIQHMSLLSPSQLSWSNVSTGIFWLHFLCHTCDYHANNLNQKIYSSTHPGTYPLIMKQWASG